MTEQIKHPSTWEAEAKMLAEELKKFEEFAIECASYACTCHPAYVDRDKIDPDCQAGEIGDIASKLLGLEPKCKGRQAFLNRHKS